MVGAPVGSVEGDAEGSAVGFIVGNGVGTSEGSAVGANVGSGVGATGATKDTEVLAPKWPSPLPKVPPERTSSKDPFTVSSMPSPNESNRVNTYSWWAQISVLTTSSTTVPARSLE